MAAAVAPPSQAYVALVVVPDEGAAEMVRAALVDAGIEPRFERAYPDHPYRVTALAEPWRVLVPGDALALAQQALARLEHDLRDETDRQARAWHGRPDPVRHEAGEGQPESDLEASAPAGSLAARRPQVFWALALAALIPFPAVLFYAKARRMGAILLGIFVIATGLGIAEQISGRDFGGVLTLPRPTPARSWRRREPTLPAARDNVMVVNLLINRTFVLGAAAKLVDAGLGLGLIALARRRATRRGSRDGRAHG